MNALSTPALTPWAAKYLSDRDVSSELARTRGYRSVTCSADLPDLNYGTFSKGVRKHIDRPEVEGIAIPVNVPGFNPGRDEQGQPIASGTDAAHPYWSIRWNIARVTVNKETGKSKAAKVENPAGIHKVADFHPTEDSEGGIIAIVEGIAKADSLLTNLKTVRPFSEVARDVRVAGIGGVYDLYAKPDPKAGLPARLSPAAHQVKWRGKTALIVFDSDSSEKVGVCHAIRVTGQLLTEAGANVIVARIPKISPGAGVDDVLAASNDPAGFVEDLLSFAKPQNKGKITPLTVPYAIWADWWMNAGRDYLTDIGRGDLLADICLAENDYRAVNDAWWHYNGIFWEEDSSTAILRRSAQVSRMFLSWDRDAQDKQHSLNQRLYAVKNAVTYAKTQPRLNLKRTQLNADPYLLNLPCGTVRLGSANWRKEVRPHDPDDLQVAVTAANPRLDDALTPGQHAAHAALHKYLDEVIVEDDLAGGWVPDLASQHFIQMWAGSVLIGRVTPRALFLFGDGANGKSLLALMMASALDDFYAVTLTPKLLTDDADDFALSPLSHGALLAIVSETAKYKVLDESTFKQLVSDDELTINEKNKPRYKIHNKASTLFLTNHLPRVISNDWGTWRRIHAYKFRNTFAEDPNYLVRMLHEEILSEMLAWMLDGAAMYVAAGCRLTPSPAVLADTARYRSGSIGSVEQMLIDSFDFDPNSQSPEHFVKRKELYDYYRHYCTTTKSEAMKYKNFLDEVRNCQHPLREVKNSIWGFNIRPLADSDFNDAMGNYFRLPGYDVF